MPSAPLDPEAGLAPTLQTYAGLVASLLMAAVTAQVKGQLADVASEVTAGKPLPPANRGGGSPGLQ